MRLALLVGLMLVGGASALTVTKEGCTADPLGCDARDWKEHVMPDLPKEKLGQAVRDLGLPDPETNALDEVDPQGTAAKALGKAPDPDLSVLDELDPKKEVAKALGKAGQVEPEAPGSPCNGKLANSELDACGTVKRLATTTL